MSLRVHIIGLRVTMPLTLGCKNCGRKFDALDHLVGRKTKCSHCGTVTAIAPSRRSPGTLHAEPESPRKPGRQKKLLRTNPDDIEADEEDDGSLANVAGRGSARSRNCYALGIPSVI